MRKRRYFGNYEKKFGENQAKMVEFYYRLGKNVDEIQELLQCPRASVRGRLSEIKRHEHHG